MPNTINLRLLENKNIIAEMQGIPLANENSYKIIAGESNATNFKIASKPLQYKDARYTVEMVNSQGCGIEEKDIENDTFILPEGMAVAGYGIIKIKAYLGEEEVPFMPLKIKVWNTLPNWNKGVSKDTKIVQGLGDSYVDVMSQQAVTREIKRLSILSPEGFDKINKRVDTLYQLLEYGKVGKVAEDVPNNSPFRQTGVYFDSDIGENIALDVMDKSPTTVTKIQGKGTISGIKSTGRNLFPTFEQLESFRGKDNGFEVSYTDTGFYLSGTPTSVGNNNRVSFFSTGGERIPLKIPAGTYTFYSGVTWGQGINSNYYNGIFNIVFYDKDNQLIPLVINGVEKTDISAYTNSITFTLKGNCVKIYLHIYGTQFSAEKYYDNLLFAPILQIGESVGAYEPSGKESIMTLPTPLTLGKFDVWEDNKVKNYTKKYDLEPIEETLTSYYLKNLTGWEGYTDVSDGVYETFSAPLSVIRYKSHNVLDVVPEFRSVNYDVTQGIVEVSLYNATTLDGFKSLIKNIETRIDITATMSLFSPLTEGDTVGKYINWDANILLEDFDENSEIISLISGVTFHYQNGVLEVTTPEMTPEEFNELFSSGNEYVLYKTLTPISITDFIFNNEYKAYNGGTEQMLGLVDNIVPTVYNEYLISIGKEEGDDI